MSGKLRLTPSDPTSIPGFRSPGAGFEAPFDMLAACHERITSMLALLAKLPAHVAAHGTGEPARRAASDVVRYFDLAAPLHHQDEELHVFPPLLAGADADMQALVVRLQQDHRDMEAAWARARVTLQSLAAADAAGPAPLLEPERATLHDFAALYEAHLAAEDALAFPRARESLTPAALQAMSADMMQRRGARVPLSAPE